MLKSILDEEKTEHAFTVNQLVAKLDRADRDHEAYATKSRLKNSNQT